MSEQITPTIGDRRFNDHAGAAIAIGTWARQARERKFLSKAEFFVLLAWSRSLDAHNLTTVTMSEVAVAGQYSRRHAHNVTHALIDKGVMVRERTLSLDRGSSWRYSIRLLPLA